MSLKLDYLDYFLFVLISKLKIGRIGLNMTIRIFFLFFKNLPNSCLTFENIKFLDTMRGDRRLINDVAIHREFHDEPSSPQLYIFILFNFPKMHI